jgi:hypothetical protein
MVTTMKPKAKRNRCGLCGKTGKLRKTECCGNWICDDHDKYVPFSYGRNSCNRNHDHYTLCGYHHNEGHEGDWKDCKECLDSFETEMYVWYATNDYNFEKLENPPTFEPTHCSECGKVIRLGKEGFSQLGDKYTYNKCTEKEMRMGVAQTKGPKSK